MISYARSNLTAVVHAPRSLAALINRDPMETCSVKVEVMEELMRVSVTGEVLQEIFNSWVLLATRERYRRKIMEEAIEVGRARVESPAAGGG